MPKPLAFANAFTAKEVAKISGLSVHMVSYLANNGFLLPSHQGTGGRRGSTRYYSYRDLVMARLINRLGEAGIELKRLKVALGQLQKSDIWSRLGGQAACAMLVTDGNSILVHEEDGSILDLTKGGQLAFAFVMDLAATDTELRGSVDEERRKHFSYNAQPLKVAAN